MPTLDWIGKDKVINHHKDVPYKVLERKYSFDEGGMHKEDIHSNNMIIHGDNLEALKSFLPQYEGKIKCIYIDPPYNTGNEGWIYNDNVNDPKIKKWLGEVVGKEGEDLSRHDKWLCMMYPRLVLLQKLLAEDGAIFISIDDNEHANLLLVCNEIFGSNNFIQDIIWNKRVSPARDAKFFSTDHEYILVYSKNKESLTTHFLPRTEKNNSYYKNPDNDPRGPWNSAAYTCNKSRDERPNLYYPITNPYTGEKIFPKESAVWAYSEETYQQHVRDNLLYWGVNGEAKQPRKKAFLSEVGDVVPRSVWSHSDVGSTQKATMENNTIFNMRAFSYPKVSTLVERIIQIASDKDSIVLDSFAGSGTTAHAVLNMNKSDGGNRKFILVEMGDYADTITAERVKRVINGYGEEKNAVEGTGGNFSYYELGNPLFMQDGTINNEVDITEVRKYVWYTETNGIEYKEDIQEKYFLGSYNDTAYYFYYEKDRVTILDYEFLTSVHKKEQTYVMYADSCALSDSDLQKWNITFKKIPRDIEHI